jgi:hypothetical protein
MNSSRRNTPITKVSLKMCIGNNKIALNQIEECEKDDTVYELRKRLEGITHWLQTKKEGRRGVY